MGRVNTYNFHSEWKLTHPLEKVWGVLIEAPHFWNEWWPDLVGFDILSESDERVGDMVRYTWRSFLGYHLEFIATMTTYQPPNLIIFDVDGDLRGTGRWEFHENSGVTVIDIDWQVVTTRRWMNMLSPLLKPLFRLSHNIVMRRGEKGLQLYLKRQGQPSTNLILK